MTTLYFVGPWDLSRDLACFPDDPDAGRVLLVESLAKSRALPFPRKKLVLVLSAPDLADSTQFVEKWWRGRGRGCSTT